MQTLFDLLFAGADLLLVPVVIGLLGLVGYALFTLGSFLRETLTRRHGVAALAPLGSGDPASARLELERLELRCARTVDRDALISRLGPMFGLAGTLIPLGPGLRQLHEGNLAGLGNQLAVAFATTVAGLFVCAICFWVAGVRGRWYEQDLRSLERQHEHAGRDRG